MRRRRPATCVSCETPASYVFSTTGLSERSPVCVHHVAYFLTLALVSRDPGTGIVLKRIAEAAGPHQSFSTEALSAEDLEIVQDVVTGVREHAEQQTALRPWERAK